MRRPYSAGPTDGREPPVHEGSGEVSSKKLGAVGRGVAPVAVAVDRRATHRSVVMMSASRRRTAALLGRITESNKARAHWIDLIRDAR